MPRALLVSTALPMKNFSFSWIYFGNRMTWSRTQRASIPPPPNTQLFWTNSVLNFPLLAPGSRMNLLTENKGNICLTLVSHSGMRQALKTALSRKVTFSKLGLHLWISLSQTGLFKDFPPPRPPPGYSPARTSVRLNRLSECFSVYTFVSSSAGSIFLSESERWTFSLSISSGDWYQKREKIVKSLFFNVLERRHNR